MPPSVPVAQRVDDLIPRLQARIADPLRANDYSAHIRPIEPVPPPATKAQVEAAETALGFSLPPLLRRVYMEVANGGWGPHTGLEPLPAAETEPDGNDLVSFYHINLEAAAAEAPALNWPPGIVPLIDGHYLYFCDFLHPPHPIYRIRTEDWDVEIPLTESLVPVAPSPEEWLEAWLAGPP
jgi:hypothetical protein